MKSPSLLYRYSSFEKHYVTSIYKTIDKCTNSCCDIKPWYFMSFYRNDQEDYEESYHKNQYNEEDWDSLTSWY